MMMKTISALALAMLLAPAAWASSLTVLGSVGGRVYFDGKDYGPIPVRITQVTSGNHTVRVVTPGNAEKTFNLEFPGGTDANPVVDMDQVLGLTAQRDDRRERRRYRRPYYDPYYGGYHGGYSPYGGYGGYPYGYGPYYGGSGISFGFGGGRRRGGFGGFGSGIGFGFGF